MDLNEMDEKWQEIAPTLAAMEKTNPFSVPDRYFNEMQQQLYSRLKVGQFDNEKPYFNVPDNYFDILESKITSVIQLEKLKPISESQEFSIPENYFDTLEKKIRTRIESEEIKTSQPKIRQLLSSWVIYAAAASIVAIISFGLYFNNRSNNLEAQIAKLPADEIVDYLQLYSDVGDAPLIIKNLGTEFDISELSTDVIDQEIEQYLELN